MKPEEFINSVKELGISLTDTMLNNLEIYAKYLIEYNQHTNLTAITDIKLIYLKHFYDSLTIAKVIDLNSVNTLADVGSGAGFPGLVLKIVFPHLSVTLIDSNNKKVTFLNSLIAKLNLENVEAINERSEIYAHKHSELFDVVTSRAVASLPVLIELCLPLVKVGGYFIPLKGNIEDELNISKDILATMHGQIDKIECFSLPKEESMRNILKIKKEDKTPSGYPRSYDKIKKSLKKYLK